MGGAIKAEWVRRLVLMCSYVFAFSSTCGWGVWWSTHWVGGEGAGSNNCERAREATPTAGDTVLIG